MEKQSYCFIGRAGAGKGTQTKLLIESLRKIDPAHPIIDVETGAEFRKFIKGTSHTAILAKQIVESGGLMPEFMPIFLWGNVLVSKYTGLESLIFDGTPRKLDEAMALQSLFPFYGMGKPWIIYLDIDHEESHKRLTLRAKEGRKDDDQEAIKKRQQAYEKDVKPTIEYYRTNPNVNFLDIDGEQSIESVHNDILKGLGIFARL